MKTRLKNGEKVVLETRLHWMTMAIPFLVSLAAIVAGILIGGYGLLLTLAFMGYYVYKIIDRNNNIWAVTNTRVVDEYGVFSHNTKESPLDKINNVSYHQSFWGKILGYGDVQIQTAAEIGSTTYKMVMHPGQLKDTITRMQEEYQDARVKKQAAELADAIIASHKDSKPDVPAELEKLFELKQKGVITEEEFASRKSLLLNS